MDPNSLLPPASHLGYPAPFWFLELFKVLGFTLHMVPMHLFYAGFLIIMITSLTARGDTLRASKRLAHAMPVIVSLGVNLGVVPLLFTQVAYHQFYYPTGILIAWPWISVIFMLIIAYYGVYIYTINIRKDKMSNPARVMGWAGAVLFVIIGFLFANNFSLMANPGQWPEIFMATATGGSPNGVALNTGDPTLLPRWLMMFGMAITTVAVFMAVDAAFFASRNAESYRTGLGRFTAVLYTIGTIIFAGMAYWYIFGTLDEAVSEKIWQSDGLTALVIITGLIPLVVLGLMAAQFTGIKKWFALAAGICQFIMLALNAVSRQWVQNIETGRYLDVSKGMVDIQWSTMILFLISFVVGIVIIIWMLKQIWNAAPSVHSF